MWLERDGRQQSTIDLINGSTLTEAAGTLNSTLKIALQTHIVDGPNVSDLEGPLEIQFMA